MQNEKNIFPLTISCGIGKSLCTDNSIRKKYLHSYHAVKDSTFSGGFGVTGLCELNKDISCLVVPDAKAKRLKSKDWRRKCSDAEIIKLTVSNFICRQAVESSTGWSSFKEKSNIALARAAEIISILDTPL